MARGRPKRNSVQLTFRLDFNYLEKLKLLNPQLLTTDISSGQRKFRHGALGRYLERLIRADLEKRANASLDEITEPEIDLDAIMGKDSNA